MKQAVYKIKIEAYRGPLVVHVPHDAKILRCGNQRDKLVVWILGDWESKERKPMELRVVGTGHNEIDLDWIYVDTVMFNDGSLVLHVFEVLPT